MSNTAEVTGRDGRPGRQPRVYIDDIVVDAAVSRRLILPSIYAGAEALPETDGGVNQLRIPVLAVWRNGPQPAPLGV